MPHRILFLLAALGFAAPAAAQHFPDLPPPPQTAGIAIPDGQIDKAVAEVDAIVERVMRETGIPGIAVAVVSRDAVLLQKGYGVRRAGETAAVDADTVFQLASLSKPVGATVVAQQVGEGGIGWDTPMKDVMPWFTLADPNATAMLTIGDLYAHRSGLPDHAGDDLEDLGFPQRVILERLRHSRLDGFRTHYAYTNFGLTAAAEAVAAVAGKDWATLSGDALYGPLGMTSASSRLEDFLARDNRVHGHVRSDGAWRALYQRKPDAQSPAGGVSASVADMAKWMRLILGMGAYEGRRLIEEDALLAAIGPQSVSGRPYAADARASFYGYGFGVGTSPAGRVMLSHSGAFALGAATNVVMIPSADIGIVILSNAAPIGAVEAIGMSFADLVQYGNVRRDWLTMYGALMKPLLAPFGRYVGKAPPADPRPSRPLADYAGTFANAYYGDLLVEETGGALVMKVAGATSAFALEHWDGDEFVFRPSNENATEGSISSVLFAFEKEAAPGRVTVEYFDQEQDGTFVRR
ncbi:serine hydrolase [Nitratireductor pacificus]|uniref:Beta-lactamase n=1 Tax=Nitratireductor pacificus pht-3B TaxID=391937 RepID=K2MYZ8_9HYPH|nr:serine hydrolase [Nitratireductor pacificus]EKF17198.1 beta-lactamase [Nitratireductor pacificus pht-3B]